MDKTISITIAGVIVHVEERAFKELEAWLSSVRRHFGQYDDSEEILQDIENRIAEILSERTDNRKRAVTSEDVREVVEQIGTIEDFEHFEDDPAPEAKPNPTVPKRLYRDPDNSVLGGVAAGVAAYMGVDVTLARILFVIFTLIWGASLLLYVVLWLIMPIADTAAKKLEMKGEPLTLARLEQRIKETMPPGHEVSSTLGRLLHRIANVLRDAGEAIVSFLQKSGPILMTLIGWLLMIAGGVLVILVVTLYLIGITDSTVAIFDVSLSQMASGLFMHYVLLTSVFLLLVIPAILIVMAGSTLSAFNTKRFIPSPVVLLSIWVIALIIASIVGLRELPAYQENLHHHFSETSQTVRELPPSLRNDRFATPPRMAGSGNLPSETCRFIPCGNPLLIVSSLKRSNL
ncbi:MAG: PspC domain-containing protein [Balneolaceae bacterium]